MTQRKNMTYNYKKWNDSSGDGGGGSSTQTLSPPTDFF